MKKRFFRRVGHRTVWLAVLLMLCACGSHPADPSATEQRGWTLKEIPLPSGYTVDPMEIPEYDPERDAIRCYAFTTRNEGGTILHENRCYTVQTDGTILEEADISIAPTERVTLAVFGEETDFFVSVDSDPKARRYALCKRNTETGELQSVLLTQYYPDGEKPEPDFMTADPDGDLYIGIGKALLLFDMDLGYLKTMTFPGKEFTYRTLGRSADGEIFLSTTWSLTSEDGVSLSLVDKTVDQVGYGSQFNSIDAIPAFPHVSDGTGNFYAWSEAGLWRMTPGAANQYHAEQTADFAAENLRFSKGKRKAGYSWIALPVRDDFFLCTKCKMREGIAVADLCVLSNGEES